MIQTLLIIIAVLLGLVALFLFFALRQNSLFESRIKKLEDKNNPHNFSHPSSKMHKDFDVNNLTHISFTNH